MNLPVDARERLRFKTIMTRTGTPDVAELMALLAANAAEIAALKAEKDALAQRVFKLEEELALAQLHRFAPRSEKHMDRVFNEAEQATLEGDADEDTYEADAVDLPDTGLPEIEKPEGKKPGRRPLPANLPLQRVGVWLHLVGGQAEHLLHVRHPGLLPNLGSLVALASRGPERSRDARPGCGLPARTDSRADRRAPGRLSGVPYSRGGGRGRPPASPHR